MVLPDVDDNDIAWVCDVLELPKTAFHGSDGRDYRAQVLKSTETMDIEACPGSGKTTLLVAKLAILARKWSIRRSGVCVLSHTNAARREIESRLGNTEEGQRLLSYPHFIGTIHGFVNEFLAIPQLRSVGLSVEIIDDEVCLEWRWRRLPEWVKEIIESVGHTKNILRYKEMNGDLGDVRWGKGFLGKETKPYKEMRKVCYQSIQAGFHCYDEMFLWASYLLVQFPDVALTLRQRFPFIFVDEVQDNSETQSSILYRVFMEGKGASQRQRFGDANQAIYGSSSQSGAITDRFPVDGYRKDLKNSFRFGPSIAGLSDPLAVDPQGLVGCGGFGPNGEPDKVGKNAIFLFTDNSINQVMEVYANYLLTEFSGLELESGKFSAVGAVHRSEKDVNVPRFVGHYWPAYRERSLSPEVHSKTFVEYALEGHYAALVSGEARIVVDRVGKAMIRLVKLADPDVKLAPRKNAHRYVLELLDGTDEKSDYRQFVERLIVGKGALTKAEWKDRWREIVERAVSAITGVDGIPRSAIAFLEWPESTSFDENVVSLRANNVFSYPEQEPKVQIRVGSIHSVKGETHTATLVLDTFFRTHHLKKLKPWLCGKRSGGAKASESEHRRLKLHYVGMTRPSRLLCLAMREDAFSENEIQKLKESGWRVGRVGDNVQWL